MDRPRLHRHVGSVIPSAEGNYRSLLRTAEILYRHGTTERVRPAKAFVLKTAGIAVGDRSKQHVSRVLYLAGVIRQKTGSVRAALRLLPKLLENNSKASNPTYEALKELDG